MAVEIERKFLVKGDAWREGMHGAFCRQGYINTESPHTVRVRIAEDRAFLTLKSAPLSAARLSRLEFEYEIPTTDARQMLDQLCAPDLIEKTRYRVPFENFIWEVDVFHGANEGLVVAEIEMTHENQEVPLPPWVGEEVTQDRRYTNAALASVPFQSWK